MNPTLSSFRSPAALVGVAAVLAFAPFAQAAAVSSWTQFSGTISSGLNTSSPVLGNGVADSADNQTLYATVPTSTLANVGDSVTLSGSVVFSNLATPQADQFRFGIYDVNGQSGATGWLGYFASNSGTSGGPTYSRLWERNNPNTGSFGSGTGATTIASVNASPSNTSFVSGTYSFSLIATKASATSLALAWTLIHSTAGTSSVSGAFTDTTPQSFTFNRVGIFAGSGLNAAQVSFSNVDFTYASAIPEPSSWAAAAGLAALAGAALRRKRR